MYPEVRQALRPLYRRPGASIAIVSMLTLGIGLTSIMFAIVDGVLLKPLPYRDPAQLVTTRSVPAKAREEWRLRTRALSDIAHYDLGLAPLLLGGSEPARLRQGAVSHNLLQTLGVTPVMGRAFTRMDAESGAEPVVILTHGAWLDHFGGRSGVVGELAPFEPIRRRIIGVLPPEFVFPMPPLAAFGDARTLTVIPLERSADGAHPIVARIAPGAGLDEVRAEEALIVRSDKGETRAAQSTQLTSAILGGTRGTLAMLLSAVALLLLIACANVTHLLLARTIDARRDLGIRLAIGASRTRVVRMILVQGLALCLAGGFLGVTVAYLGFDLFKALTPVPLPRADAAGIDARVLAFAVAVTIASGMLVSVLPAWHISGTNPFDALQPGARMTAGPQRLRQVLLALEVAVAVMLLAGAALAFNSLVRLLRVDLGFAADRVLTFRLRGPESRYPTSDHQRALLNQALERIAALPGIEQAGAVDLLPVTRAVAGGSVTILDRPELAPIDAEPRTIARDYFAAMHIDLVRGRAFAASDTPTSPPVAIVNEAFARRLPPADDGLGRRIRHRNVDREIIGVVRDVRTYAVDAAAEPQIYVPHTQTTSVPSRIVLRTAGSLNHLGPLVRGELHAIEPSAPVEDFRTLSSHVASSLAHPRFQASLLMTFGVSSLLLIAVGVAGIVSYAVARRTREIGVRVALGARSVDVVRAVMGRPIAAVVAGLIGGLAGALVLGRGARLFLYEIEPNDPSTLAVVAAAVLLTTVAAAAIPARRAVRADPLAALRAE